MIIIWSSEIDSILGVGQSLENNGVRNWGLERDAALVALEKLSEIGVAVLGGDVYLVTNTGAESNYDNWYCNQEDREAKLDFVSRSIEKAKNYISNYQASSGSVLFAIVPDQGGRDLEN